MRKLFSILTLALACFSSAWASVYEADVSTAKELVVALQSYTKDEVHIKLLADIDMAECPDFSPVDKFTGSITGYYEYTDSLGKTSIVYRSIKNLKTSLVEKMTNAKVSGIMILDGERGGWWRNNACFLCEEASNCEFTDVAIMNCHYKNSDFGGDLYANKTGLLTNMMDHCNVTNVAVIGSSIHADGSDIGAITGVATNNCTFKGCWVDAYSSLYSDSEPNAYVGGLVGTSEDCIFERCENVAVVAASVMSDNLGGITGRSTRCSFIDCYNAGTVTQLAPVSYEAFRSEATYYYALTMVAHGAWAPTYLEYSYIALTGLKLNGKYWYNAEATYGWGAVALMTFAIAMTVYDVANWIYDKNAPDEVGGITSVAYGCTFDRCTNAGLIVCRDAYCGGIVGYADTKDGKITQINNCINTGYVQGGEQTGGIVGYLKDSHASNCFNAGAVDCLKSTNGPIYGDTNAKGATITTCFAMKHGAKYEGGASGGEGVIVEFGEEDIASGRAAYEMNRIVGTDLFRQTVGKNRYPNFTGDVVKVSDIRNDIDLTYHVVDAGSFCTALMDPFAKIELKKDIDFEQRYFTLYRGSYKFFGTIDGKGHAIRNIKLDFEDSLNETFDQDNERHAMIQYAEGATFKNLTLDSLSIKQGIMVAGLVGNSKNSTYENIHITNSEIYAYNSFAGGMVYESDHDTFTRCTTDGNTSVSTHGIPTKNQHAYAAGLVSKAKGSTFTDCVNGADVSGRLDVVGGIVALCENSTFTRCLNNGYVHHNSSAVHDNDELGGIAAEAMKSKFYECINIGKLLCEDENGGGIVGYGEEVAIINCLNESEELNFSENTCGGIIGNAKRSMVANCASIADYPLIGNDSDMNAASGNNYRLEIGNHNSSSWEMGVSAEVMASGVVAHWLNNGIENRNAGKDVWYQTLSGPFADKMPYPDGNTHLEVLISDLPHDVIRSADDLVQFAKKVNGGNQFACALLDADIDLKGIDWQPIGTEESRFRGIFDGQGHIISGLKVYVTSGGNVGAGLFGTVHAHAEIRNLIIGPDSEIRNLNMSGAGAIVGIYQTGWSWGNVIIENCGNYANVIGPQHVGAILGHVMTSEQDRNVKVYINNCFNMGDITALKGMSGLLCGNAKNSGYITNCWSNGKIERMNSNSATPFDSTNPTGEAEYFAGYDKNLYIANCYITNSPVGPNAIQKGVTKLNNNDLTGGALTYMLNGNATEGDLDWYQKIGEDAHPMFTTRGGDIVYAYLSDNKRAYTNDSVQSAFLYFGPLRVMKDFSLALLDGNSDRSLMLDTGIKVGNATLSRSFKANIPSTLVLPFSGEIDSESGAKFFSFSAMSYDEENNKYTAVMDEVEDGKFEAYTPYLALFAEDAESLDFGSVNIEPVAPAVTQQDEWYFIGSTGYKVLGLDDEESQYYYGYAGLEFDGFKLGEFAKLGEGASINPFRAYMRHIASDDAPDSFDVITKAPTRAGIESGNVVGYNPGTISMPKQFDVILKSANGETGIATFDNETGEMIFQGWYDLNGNRVDENYSGVRVGNGKKIIKK